MIYTVNGRRGVNESGERFYRSIQPNGHTFVYQQVGDPSLEQWVFVRWGVSMGCVKEEEPVALWFLPEEDA